MKECNPPILVLSYNRKDTTLKVLEKIKEHQPKRVYFYCDHPSTDSDITACNEVKDLSTWISSWTELRTFFPTKNLGPKLGVAQAISWFFENEESGIILEHDCLPSDDFFPFCTELLEKYKNNERVMHISGMAHYEAPDSTSDYCFIRIPIIWGWASWRRAWNHYDLKLQDLDRFISTGGLKKSVSGIRARANWMHYFYATKAGNIESWDYAWTYSVMRKGGLCVAPHSNMVSNIGFSAGALNCTDVNNKFANLPTTKISWPLRHPTKLEADTEIEDKLNHDVFRYKTTKYALHLLFLNRLLAESTIFRRIAKAMVRQFNF